MRIGPGARPERKSSTFLDKLHTKATRASEPSTAPPTIQRFQRALGSRLRIPRRKRLERCLLLAISERTLKPQRVETSFTCDVADSAARTRRIQQEAKILRQLQELPVVIGSQPAAQQLDPQEQVVGLD